jgi:hypothetical protein
MTITFENDNDVIVYSRQRVISNARSTQQIFVAQCVCWIASLIGLEESLVTHIDKLHRLTIVREEQEIKKVSIPVTWNSPKIQDAVIQESKQEHQDTILKECEEYLKDSRRLREIAALKATGKTLTGLIYPMPISKKQLRKKDRIKKKRTRPEPKESKTAGINKLEIRGRKEAGECLRCAWPPDKTGSHRVRDCIHPIKLDKGTPSYPKAKEFQKLKVLHQQHELEEASYEESCSASSSDALL